MVDKKEVEFVFAHEADILEAVKEKKAGQCGHNGGGHNSISDPTAVSAIRNMEEVAYVSIEYGASSCGRERRRVRYPERWLKAMEWTKAYYNEPSRAEQGRLIDIRYKQCLSRDEACELLHIGYGKYHTMLNDVIAFCAGVATGLGI